MVMKSVGKGLLLQAFFDATTLNWNFKKSLQKNPKTVEHISLNILLMSVRR